MEGLLAFALSSRGGRLGRSVGSLSCTITHASENDVVHHCIDQLVSSLFAIDSLIIVIDGNIVKVLGQVGLKRGLGVVLGVLVSANEPEAWNIPCPN